MSKINPAPMPSIAEINVLKEFAQQSMWRFNGLMRDNSPNTPEQRARVAMCFHLSTAFMVALEDLQQSIEAQRVTTQ